MGWDGHRCWSRPWGHCCALREGKESYLEERQKDRLSLLAGTQHLEIRDGQVQPCVKHQSAISNRWPTSRRVSHVSLIPMFTVREDNAVMVSSANSSHLIISSRSGQRQPVIMHHGMWLVWLFYSVGLLASFCRRGNWGLEDALILCGWYSGVKTEKGWIKTQSLPDSCQCSSSPRQGGW